jgi:hypothetical protein
MRKPLLLSLLTVVMPFAASWLSGHVPVVIAPLMVVAGCVFTGVGAQMSSASWRELVGQVKSALADGTMEWAWSPPKCNRCKDKLQKVAKGTYECASCGSRYSIGR